MGIILQIFGGALVAVGGLAFAFIVLGVGAEADPTLWVSLRAPYEQMLGPSGELRARVANMIAFLVLVGPGLAVFYLGRNLNKPKSTKK